jgi:hypothetical protein
MLKLRSLKGEDIAIFVSILATLYGTQLLTLWLNIYADHIYCDKLIQKFNYVSPDLCIYR